MNNIFFLIISLFLLVIVIINVNAVTVNPILGEQKVIAVKFKPQGLPEPAIMKEFIVEKMQDVNNFYVENSYGKMSLKGQHGDFSVEDVYPSQGAYDIELPYSCTEDEKISCNGLDDITTCEGKGICYLSCDPREILNEIIAVADSEIVFEEDLSILIFASEGQCPHRGLGSRQRYQTHDAQEPLELRNALIFSPSSSTIGHELGHGFGLGHAGYSSCGVEVENCEVDEYGDPYDRMGNGGFFHFNAFNKYHLGWLTEDQELHRVVTIGANDEGKTFYLDSLEDNNEEIQALKLPNGITSDIFIEWRQNTGLDKNIISQINCHLNDVFDGVSLRTISGQSPILFDAFPPGGSTLSVLPYGETWTNPLTGMRIRVGERPRGATQLNCEELLRGEGAGETLNPEPVAITIEDVGRTDFTPPTINDIIITPTDDPCVVNVEVPVNDESGISKVEFLASSWEGTEITQEGTLAPFIFNFNYLDYTRQISIKAYDNAYLQGGNLPNNIAYKIFTLERNFECQSPFPEIILESPYLEESYSTEDNPGRINYINFPLIRGALPLKISANAGEGHISAFHLTKYAYVDENGILRLISPPTLLATGISLDEENKEFVIERLGRRAIVLQPGEYVLEIVVSSHSGDFSTRLGVIVKSLSSNSFRRGDVNEDDRTDLSDAVYILNWLFAGGSEPQCKDAADTNDDGQIIITDAVYLLNYLFLGDPEELPIPNRESGVDRTYDELNCNEQEMHTTCRDNACVAVAGAGDNECVINYDCSCPDTDATEQYPDGNNPFIKGEISTLYEAGEDECFDAGNLMERKCTYPYISKVNCGNLGDYICQDGACVENI